MIEPPPDALLELIAAETAAPVTSSVAQAAVRAKLGATLGIAKVAASTSAGTAAGVAGAAVGVKGPLALKVLGLVLAAGTATTAIVASRDRSAPSIAVVDPAPVMLASDGDVPLPSVAIASSEAVESEAVESVPGSTGAPAATRERPLRSRTLSASPRTQNQLLADASRAFTTGDAVHALELLDEDQRAHANGALSEERDALRVSVLVALGRDHEASELARDLLARYPHTIHRALVEHVLIKDSP